MIGVASVLLGRLAADVGDAALRPGSLVASYKFFLYLGYGRHSALQPPAPPTRSPINADDRDEHSRTWDNRPAPQMGRSGLAALQVDRAVEHHPRRADGDDELLDRAHLAARHLPRHPHRSAAAGQHQLPP